MTHDYKLAYDIFEQFVNHGEYILAVESALKKQIPKRPIKKFTFNVCPVCDRALSLHMKYCSDCGQALDWSDTE